MSETETRGGGGPGDGELPLSFEAWAELSARLANLGQEARFDILVECHVDLHGWHRCDRHYALALTDDIGKGRTDRARFYGDQCAAEMARRRKASEAPSIVAQPSDEVDPRVEPAPEPTPVLAPETAVPSFLQQREVAPVARGREHLAGTAMAFELPTALRPKAADALPFQPGASPHLAAMSPEPKAVPVPGPTAGATLGVGTDRLAEASSTLPFGKSDGGGASRVTYPRMPMQTYASFAAELSVSPAKAAEILAKYNVPSDAARAALEQEWRTRLEAHPDTRAEWEKMFATYSDWLRDQQHQ